jgi:copper oxidase (laccase) domain-containing protein
MKSYTHDDLLAFRFDSLPNGDGPIHHAVFSRLGGVSLAPFDSLNMSLAVADERDRVYANRRRAYGLFGRDTDTVVHAHLVHGADGRPRDDRPTTARGWSTSTASSPTSPVVS